MLVSSQASVLVVDALEETREVLRDALERRGWHTLATDRVDVGLQWARDHRPACVVLDLEMDALALGDNSAELATQFRAASTADNRSLLVLGSDPVPGAEHVSKPYHYATLIRKIEALLEAQ